MNPTPRTEDAKHRYWMGGGWSDKFFRFAQVLESENITLEARVAELEKLLERVKPATLDRGFSSVSLRKLCDDIDAMKGGSK